MLVTLQILIRFISRFYLALTILVLTMITILSLWPIAALPAVAGTDKIHHFIAYALLMIPVAIKQHKYRWLIAVFFMCYSGAIELIQPYINRYGEWLDLAANVGGLVIGMLLAQLFLFLAKAKEC